MGPAFHESWIKIILHQNMADCEGRNERLRWRNSAQTCCSAQKNNEISRHRGGCCGCCASYWLSLILDLRLCPASASIGFNFIPSASLPFAPSLARCLSSSFPFFFLSFFSPFLSHVFVSLSFFFIFLLPFLPGWFCPPETFAL